MLAVRKGDGRMAKLLLDNGADMNLVDNKGVSPLMLSVYYGCPQVGQYSNDESMTRMRKGIRVLKLFHRRSGNIGSVARLNNVGDGIDGGMRMIDVNNCLTDISVSVSSISSSGRGRGSGRSSGRRVSRGSGGGDGSRVSRGRGSVVVVE